jgi:hypothetical protein
MIRLLTFALLATTALAQQPNPTDLMRRAIDADLANDKLTPDYTYHQQRTVRAFNKDGKESGAATWVWDVTPLKTYDNVDRKLIARSGEKVSLDLDYVINVGPGMIPSLFDLTLLREEELRGRKSWVLIGTAKPKATPKSDNDRELLNYRFTIWIDQEDGFPSQMKMEIVTEKARLEKGSALESFHQRNDDGVWLLQEIHFFYVPKRGKRGEILDRYTDYRKFDVKSRIVGVEP